MTGTVFNIQRFSTHDGPGIRTTVFLQGCPLRCFWCQNPESQGRSPSLLDRESTCTGCGGCVSRCPRGACILRDGRAATDRTLCTACGRCIEVCPNELRTLSGYTATAEEVMDTVLRDRAMYRRSGGGLTLSGGEVTMQAPFALELLRMAKEEGLHTAIETCGFCRRETLDALLEYTDLVMFDLKCADPALHRKGTGVDNALILENAERTAKRRETLFRMPLIPGFNDSPDEVAATARLAASFGADEDHLELLRYNDLGEEKFSRLGRQAERPRLTRQTEEYFESLKQTARAALADIY